jgi:hypothetical protein
MKGRNRLFCIIIIFGLVTILAESCNKLVSVPPPVNTISTSQVFSSDIEATAAIEGVYFNMINQGTPEIFCGGMTIYGGASADEFLFFNQGFSLYEQFQNNELLSNNGVVVTDFWQNAYSTIYGCNSIIEGLTNPSPVHDSVKNELIGEAKFVRAFSYFYLVNLFGTPPLVTTINYNKTDLLPNSSADSIYALILSDLKDAQSRVATDYSVAKGQRIIPNKWAVTALLARVYLYLGDMNDAFAQASAVIQQSGLYSLVGLDTVFKINSNEAIWQLQQNILTPPYNATIEGNMLIPGTNSSQPFVYLTSELLNAFEPGDNRKSEWLDSTNYAGQAYYYPFKYQIGPTKESPTAGYTEYYMVLRLAEQYLIRAEAEANGAGGGIGAAILDIDTIRNRAGLADYSGSQVPDSVHYAIEHERQIELFAEWGHRWFDLKRWNIASQILSMNKGISVSNDALLFPIPFSELTLDPNLQQNVGYH